MAGSALREALLNLERSTTTPELVHATTALCRLKDPGAVPALIEVLGYNNPAVAAIATEGLIALGTDVVPTLLGSLDPKNYGARAWVVRALAVLRDPRGLNLLDQALRNDIAPSVRRSATRGLATLDLKGTEQGSFERCCNALVLASRDDEWVVRYAAAFGLEQRLRGQRLDDPQTQNTQDCLHRLASPSEDARVVRLRAQLALQRLQAG